MRSASFGLTRYVRALRAGSFSSLGLAPRSCLFWGTGVARKQLVRVPPVLRGGLAFRLRRWRVGRPAGLRQSGAMPPFTCLHRGSAATASYNWLLDADAQVRPAALRPRFLCAGQRRRYAS